MTEYRDVPDFPGYHVKLIARCVRRCDNVANSMWT